MTTFIASYDPNTQTAMAYSPDEELELLFGLVNGDEWLPIMSFKDGTPKEIPSCFSPDEEILTAMTRARIEGKTNTIEID